MAARKKVVKRKAGAAPAKKKASPARKAAAPAKKKAAAPAKKKAAVAAKAKPAATPKPVAAPPPAAAGAISADAVLLGHVMGLRPRVHVGFKPSAFADAKRALAGERYATLEAAARAVAEKAIELSNEFSPGSPFSRR